MALRHAIIALLRVRQKNQASVNDAEAVKPFCAFKTTIVCADLPDRYSGH